jgi:hypothetical protein
MIASFFNNHEKDRRSALTRYANRVTASYESPFGPSGGPSTV